MPVKKAKKASRAVAGESSASPATEAGGVPAKAGSKRILLVDDDHEIGESMRTVLESRGFQATTALR
jgi:PleD family two-component response regulator